MKFVLVGLYYSPLFRENPLLAHKKAKNRGSGNRVSDFRVSGGPPVPFCPVQLSIPCKDIHKCLA